MGRTWPWMALVSLLVVGCAPPVVSTLPTHTVSFSPTPTTVPTVMATRTPTVVTTHTPTPTATPQPMIPTEDVQTVTFTIVYDNNRYDERLHTAWGFSCLVEAGETMVLFDTGGDGAMLLNNMMKLGLDPQAIDTIVLSHAHGDHTGGLGALLSTGAQPVVYVPASFSSSFKDGVRARTELVEVAGPMEILPGFYTTGEVGSGIVEQALVVETWEGLVVVTGCAHPGVVEMVRQARDVRRARESVGGEVYLVMGGFHLGNASRQQIEGIIADFRDLGVQKVSPCHCTGDLARQMFAEAFGADFVPAGVGRVIPIGLEGLSE
jgi:7,8-dihydropterin-6-yl-methyl-4-(beta-D-ribofuranosyl)aminobenzene 5'-phosphate synthase